MRSTVRRNRFLRILITLLVLLGVALIAQSSAQPRSPAVVDISWPNCGAAPPRTYTTGIIGVTGGLDFHANPCLGEQPSWFTHYAVYVNTGYPGNARARRFSDSPRRCGAQDSRCLAYNYGFNAAEYAIKQADRSGVHARLWWLDVETENSWTNKPRVNRQALLGMIAAIKQDVFLPIVGIYSYPGQWNKLTGRWHNGLPAWLATGSTVRAAAVRACHTASFTGGPIWLTQYTPRLDVNLTCSDRFGAALGLAPGG